MTQRFSPTAVYAIQLMAVGLAMLFIPAWFGTSPDTTVAGNTVFVQLVGAAFIGFGASNWIARHAPMGGIYGRAVVIGNQAFSVAGALVMLGNIPSEPGAGFWLLLLVFIAGAALHGMLLFKSPKASASV